MTEFKEKYINPFTDYGFKRLFGEEPNKDLLLDFLNELLKGRIFLKLFETAEIAKLEPDEYKQYEASVNAYRDILNIKNTAFEKGMEKGKIEDAIKMPEKGLEVSLISEITGLTKKEINNLK